MRQLPCCRLVKVCAPSGEMVVRPVSGRSNRQSGVGVGPRQRLGLHLPNLGTSWSDGR
jgi:hypothetical protein